MYRRHQPAESEFLSMPSESVIELREAYGPINDSHFTELLAEREDIVISRESLRQSCARRAWRAHVVVARRAIGGGRGWAPMAPCSTTGQAFRARPVLGYHKLETFAPPGA